MPISIPTRFPRRLALLPLLLAPLAHSYVPLPKDACSGDGALIFAPSGEVTIGSWGGIDTLPPLTTCVWQFALPEGATLDFTLHFISLSRDIFAACDESLIDVDGSQLCWQPPTRRHVMRLRYDPVVVLEVGVDESYAKGVHFSWSTSGGASPSPTHSSSSSATVTASAAGGNATSTSTPTLIPTVTASTAPSVNASSSSSASATASSSASSTQTRAPAQPSPSTTSTATHTAAVSSSRSSSPSPSMALPTLPASSSTSTCSMTVTGDSSWGVLTPSNLIRDASTALLDATGVQEYRITGMLLSAPRTLTWQVCEAATDGEMSAVQLATMIFSQLNTPGSRLMTGTVFTHARTDSFRIVWQTPASISLDPTALQFSVSGGSIHPASQSLSIGNSGGSALVITAISLAPVADMPPAAASLFTASWVAAGGLPFSAPPGYNQPSIVVTARGGVPSGMTNSIMLLLTIEHNLLHGQHVVPIILTPPPPVTPNDVNAIFSSTGFAVGSGMTAGAIFLLALCTCICYCRYCRRKSAPLPPSGSVGMSSASSARPPHAQQSFLAFIFGIGPRGGPPPAAAASAINRQAQLQAGDSDEEEGERIAFSGKKASRDTDVRALASPAASDSSSSGTAGVSIEMSAMRSTPAAPAPAAASASSALASTITSGFSTSSDTPSTARLQLKSKPSLKPTEFESRWESLATVEIFGASLQHVLSDGEMEKLLAAAGVACMASGTVAGVSKYYFFAQEEETGKLCMAEVSVTIASLRMSAVVKAADSTLGPQFVATFKSALRSVLKE